MAQGIYECKGASFSCSPDSSCIWQDNRRTSWFGLQTTGLFSMTCLVRRPVSMSDSKQMMPW